MILDFLPLHVLFPLSEILFPASTFFKIKLKCHSSVKHFLIPNKLLTSACGILGLLSGTDILQVPVKIYCKYQFIYLSPWTNETKIASSCKIGISSYSFWCPQLFTKHSISANGYQEHQLSTQRKNPRTLQEVLPFPRKSSLGPCSFALCISP